MKVLLIKDVASLGKAGEVKEVKPGYGQNFLIKKGLAKSATDEVMAQFEQEQQELKEKEAAEIKEATELKEKIEASQFVIKHKVGGNGHLIGSVTNKEVAAALSDFGIELDKKQIHLDVKVKTIGIFEADCKLGHGIHATARFDVIEEK